MTASDIFLPINAFFGDIIYPPGSTYGPRLQQKLQFVSIYQGSLTVWIDEVPVTYGENQVCMLLPGHTEYFEFSRSAYTHHGWVDLLASVLPDEIRMALTLVPPALSLSPLMKLLFNQGLGVQRANLKMGSVLCRLIAAQILWLYLSEGEQRQAMLTDPTLHPIILQVREYIDMHLAQKLTLESLARDMSVSKEHLIRLFKTAFGQTPMKYIWNQRATLGVELLKHSGLPIHLIAEQCGFQSSNHFSRRIRQMTGQSPLRLRKNFWQGTNVNPLQKQALAPDAVDLS